MKSKTDDIEKARRELIILYLGIKLRKEEEVLNYIILINYLFILGNIINRRGI